MFCYKITINSGCSNVEDLIYEYMSNLYQKSIILNKFNIIKNKNSYSIIITTYDDNISKIINKNNILKNAKTNHRLELFIEYLGIIRENSGLCQCTSSPFLILYSNGEDGPIICGECLKNVYLRKMPNISEAVDYYNILNWKDAYENMYDFWLSSVNDEMSYYEINNISSELSKYGLEICEKFNSVSKISLYYALNKNAKNNKCPKCKNELQKIERKKPFTHICKKCKLIFIEQEDLL